jgi:hypothetical protein
MVVVGLTLIFLSSVSTSANKIAKSDLEKLRGIYSAGLHIGSYLRSSRIALTDSC